MALSLDGATLFAPTDQLLKAIDTGISIGLIMESTTRHRHRHDISTLVGIDLSCSPIDNSRQQLHAWYWFVRMDVTVDVTGLYLITASVAAGGCQRTAA